MSLFSPEHKAEKSSAFETCAICHSITETPKDFPVENRSRYVAGVGELCQECYSQLFGAKAHVGK